jgi:TPR repeat protein
MARIYNFYNPGSPEGRAIEAHGYLTSGQFGKALVILERLVAEGEPVANEIGYIYELGGGGVAQDLNAAKRWYMRAIEEVDDDYAYLGLARMALEGYSDAGSPSDAIDYLSKACDANNPVAFTMLGIRYHFGETVPKDLHQAAKLYERACEQGYVLPLKYMSKLKMEQGHYLAAIQLRLKAVMAAMRLAFKDPSDPGLWGLH